MPLIGFCDDKGNRVKFEECWKLERFSGLPTEILYRIYINSISDNRPEGLSVTECLGCPRKAFLGKKEEYYENPRFLFARFRGTMVHTILEETNQMCAPGTIISEKRYERLVPGTNVNLSGKIDKYTIRTETLHDYKTIDDDKVKKLVKELPQDYIWQANIYRWILAGQGVTVRKILIHFISFKYSYTTGEECLIVPKWGSPEWEKIPACPVYDYEKVEDFLYHKVKDIVRQEMPPVVSPDKRWICQSCPFAKTHCWKEGTPR